MSGSADEPDPPATSHREILRSTSIIGTASLFNIAAAVLRTKALAVLVGPAGVGVMGLLSRVMSSTVTFVGLGLGHSGVREIAAASDPIQLARVRRALWLANLGLGLFGLALLVALRESIATWVFGDTAHAADVAWLGLGVFFSLVSASQTALLQGLRKIGDLARVTIIAALAGSFVGVALVWQLGAGGIAPMLVSVPAASALTAILYVRRLPRPARLTGAQRDLRPQWRALAQLGVPIMLATLATTLNQLLVRAWIYDELGLEATGHFEAAWAISMNYLGFVLAAMATDYYPRLTAAIADPSAANRLVNEQTDVALLLATPVLLAVTTLAPLVTHLLYSEAFTPAIEVLRLQVVGDVLKIASWPLGFVLLAHGQSRAYLLVELLWNVAYLAGVLALTPLFGLPGTGYAFVVAYAVYLAATFRLTFIARRWRTSTTMRRRLAVATAATTLIVSLSHWGATLTLAMGGVITLVVAVMHARTVLRLLRHGHKLGPIGRLLARIMRLDA